MSCNFEASHHVLPLNAAWGDIGYGVGLLWWCLLFFKVLLELGQLFKKRFLLICEIYGYLYVIRDVQVSKLAFFFVHGETFAFEPDFCTALCAWLNFHFHLARQGFDGGFSTKNCRI